MKLIIDWNDFSKKIDDFISEANTISNKEKTIKTETEFESVKKEIKDFNNRCYEFLKTSFDSESNDFAHSFYYAKQNRFHQPGQKKDFNKIKKEFFEDFNAKKQPLPYYKKILSVSDAIIKPELVELTNRESFTTDDILELILEKLYDLYDDHYHSVSMILEGNGIIQKRHGEDRELTNILEENGYIEVIHTRDASAKLTLRGRMYIEEKRKTFKENYDDIEKSQEELNERIDDIIKKLTKLGYGQEIIFDEIQELKELYTTLNKKNWGQVVKGKLIDLALAKIIDNETLKYIYEMLTDHKLRLL